LRELTEQALLTQVVPAAALVNDRGDILYLHGRSGPYLELAADSAGRARTKPRGASATACGSMAAMCRCAFACFRCPRLGGRRRRVARPRRRRCFW
jgi:hypothetical protein